MTVDQQTGWVLIALSRMEQPAQINALVRLAHKTTPYQSLNALLDLAMLSCAREGLVLREWRDESLCYTITPEGRAAARRAASAQMSWLWGLSRPLWLRVMRLRRFLSRHRGRWVSASKASREGRFSIKVQE